MDSFDGQMEGTGSLEGSGGNASLEVLLQQDVRQNFRDGRDDRGGQDLGLVIRVLPLEELRQQGHDLHVGVDQHHQRQQVTVPGVDQGQDDDADVLERREAGDAP